MQERPASCITLAKVEQSRQLPVGDDDTSGLTESESQRYLRRLPVGGFRQTPAPRSRSRRRPRPCCCTGTTPSFCVPAVDAPAPRFCVQPSGCESGPVGAGRLRIDSGVPSLYRVASKLASSLGRRLRYLPVEHTVVVGVVTSPFALFATLGLGLLLNASLQQVEHLGYGLIIPRGPFCLPFADWLPSGKSSAKTWPGPEPCLLEFRLSSVPCRARLQAGPGPIRSVGAAHRAPVRARGASVDFARGEPQSCGRRRGGGHL
jgi:hypothetical protein